MCVIHILRTVPDDGPRRGRNILGQLTETVIYNIYIKKKKKESAFVS